MKEDIIIKAYIVPEEEDIEIINKYIEILGGETSLMEVIDYIELLESERTEGEF